MSEVEAPTLMNVAAIDLSSDDALRPQVDDGSSVPVEDAEQQEKVFFFLSSASALRIVPSGALRELCKHSYRRQVPAGLQVYRQGDEPGPFYVVLSGTVAWATAPDHRGQLAAGECFGLVESLAGRPRAETVIAESDALLFTVPAESVKAPLLREALRGPLATLEANEARRRAPAPPSPPAKPNSQSLAPWLLVGALVSILLVLLVLLVQS